jgi:hypothetical protein
MAVIVAAGFLAVAIAGIHPGTDHSFTLAGARVPTGAGGEPLIDPE